jgi:hypothetical protein
MQFEKKVASKNILNFLPGRDRISGALKGKAPNNIFVPKVSGSRFRVQGSKVIVY